MLDDRYHQVNARVATMTGITTTSIIAVELIRRRRSADEIGPCGSKMPVCWQEATRKAAPTTGQRNWRAQRGRCGDSVALLNGIGPPYPCLQVELMSLLSSLSMRTAHPELWIGSISGIELNCYRAKAGDHEPELPEPPGRTPHAVRLYQRAGGIPFHSASLPRRQVAAYCCTQVDGDRG